MKRQMSLLRLLKLHIYTRIGAAAQRPLSGAVAARPGSSINTPTLVFHF